MTLSYIYNLDIYNGSCTAFDDSIDRACVPNRTRFENKSIYYDNRVSLIKIIGKNISCGCWYILDGKKI